MSNKVYLKSNSIEDEKKFMFTDIGLTLGGSNSYRVWVSMYTLRDQQGDYIAFPIKDAILEPGKKPSTLVLRGKQGYNVYNICLKDGCNYRLDSSECSWKYYDKLNEGLLIVSDKAEVSVYYEDKQDATNSGTVKVNIYGFIDFDTTNSDSAEENQSVKEVIQEALALVANTPANKAF